MFSSFQPKKKIKGGYKKIIVPFLLFIFLFSALLMPVKPAKAVIPVTDIPKLVWDKVQEALTTLWRKGGSLAFQQTLRSALNKMAFDTANWIGSGGEGQKPLFVTQGWGAYMAQIGDEAAGTFLENFSANLSKTRDDGSGLTFNYCQPSSIDVKLKIALGLSNQYRPSAPNCTASQMINNWSDAAKQYADFKDPRFLDKLVDVFDPVSSDMGIYWTAKTDMMEKAYTDKEEAKTTLIGKGGWLDPLTIDGKPISLPNQSQIQLEAQYKSFSDNFGEYTGDAFIDAANIFLNQLAINAFNKLVQSIGKGAGSDVAKTVDVLDNFESDPGSVAGETALKENTSKLIQPNFGIKADYSILSELAICPDANNPGPTNCVIDNKFMQAVSEQKTVAEALEQGYLTGSWPFEINNLPGSYQNNFSWRNVSILRKYRIVPASWEAVFEKLNQYNLAAERYPGQYQKKYATLMDLVSCYSPYDKYNEFSSQFDPADQAWCTGLVDPNWVLKAPLNYCRKEGVSSQIINKYIVPSQPAYGENPYVPSSITITRADNYCADNETCIKEAEDGSCLAYGYCNEEKRTWTFDSETCEPIDNTCQSFIKEGDKAPVAYLANTLDYEGCSAENAGCAQYTTYGTYNLQSGSVTWKEGDNLYLNDKANECSNKDEGCSEFIRVKSAWGENLVMNSNFSNDEVGNSSTGNFINDWPILASSAEIVDIAYSPGNGFGTALKLSGSTRALVYSDEENSLLPEDFDLVSGQAYTVSADVYLENGDRVTMALGSGVNRATYDTEIKNTWHHISITKTVGDGLTSADFSIAGYGSEVELYVRNIKFEMSNFDTGYRAYNSRVVYQKVLPQYLAPICYVGQTAEGYSYELKENAPDVCYDFTRECNQSEVGCEEYTSVRDKYTIPAQVSSADYCAGECVGYDIYVARETQFNSAQAENLIPDKSSTCSAESVGCTEFTNLDALNTGGESREYYSALKHCVKPNQSECANFYAWERTASGSQLKLYTLKVGATGGPATISADGAACNAEIYNATVNNPLYNADCREFYNTAGEIFYHLDSQVITCSEDCRSYRMTDRNYDDTISQAECVGANRNWDNQAGSCVSCINGGTWSNEHQACLYQGIPQEGKVCSAAENGCREYNGSAGNNVRLLDSYDFENLPSSWTSNCSGGISLANISNDRSGKSLYYNNDATNCSEIGSDKQVLAQRIPLIKHIVAGDNMAAQLKVGPYVREGGAYNIKFWASSAAGANLKMYFYNPNTGEKAEFNNNNAIRIKNGSNWQLYSVNLEELNHAVSANEILVITADNSFYLDNFIITEIVDRYYLIEGSSQIPDICYYDIFDNYQGPDYNLGCSAYLDRNKTIHNLRNFSSICSSSAVGCEQVISTQNYQPYNKGIWGDENSDGVCNIEEENCVSVPADRALYLVYDKTKNCLENDLGCSRLGEAVAGTNGAAWSDVFKKNNPNNYDSILCAADAVGCSKWRHADSSNYSYFRDPGNNTCVYRTGAINPAGQKSWYKSPMKRCDLNSDGEISGGETAGPVCLSDTDCGNTSCIADRNDYLCDISTLKTIGYGGDGGTIPVPINGAGICNEKASGCTEYIDPVSKFNPDILAISSDNNVSLQANKLYSFVSKDEEAQTINSASLSFPANDAVVLMVDNNFGEEQNRVSIGGATLGVTFKVLKNATATFSGSKESVSLKETAIAYQISDEVDSSSCNGIVNTDNGCILFNERIVSGYAGYNSLTNGYNSYISKNGSAPVNCDSTIAGSCSTNKLIKVRPDRTCATWLACSTYAFDETTGKQVCYDLKQCNSLGDDGKCNNFLPDDYKPKIENATGYYIPGQYSVSQMSEVGLNSNAHYSFEELVPSLSCKRKDTADACSYDSNIVKDLIIREPDKARVDYPIAGASYLRVPTAYKVSPMASNSFVNLSSGQDYFISYLVNTKNSGGQAVVEILSNGNEAKKITFTSSAPNNWERKVHKFRTETNGDFSQVIINLSSDANVEGEVYFDDINIEPVLKTGESSNNVANYAARACRLYPNSDSIDCRDYNKNVISQGLEGYCLEYDKANPGVCLTWYPVDRISSSLGGTALGYNGVNGLSYCTNINSNIKFAKKISTKMVYTFKDTSRGTFMGGTWDECPSDWNDPNILENVCRYCQGYTLSTSTVAACLALSPDFRDSNEDGYLDSCTSCSKKAGWAGAIPMDDDFCGFLSLSKCQEYCGDCDYYKALVVNDKDEDDRANYEKVFCVPNTDNDDLLLVKIGGETTARLLSEGIPQVSTCDSTYFYQEAWMEYNGELAQVPISTCEIKGESCEPIDESTNAEPPIRIYNPDYPAYDEQGLKLLAADSGDRDKVFNFTCSEFTQVVSSSGENKAWTVRVSPTADLEYAFETPDFFTNNISSVYLNKYGRQRTGIPYGAATFDANFDLLNSGPIYLQNQYFERENQEIFAGRPYGCSGLSCENVGYCSDNPNVICVYYPTNESAHYINTKTCSDGGYGICVPLWRAKSSFPIKYGVDATRVLSQVFAQPYGGFLYSSGSYIPSSPGYSADTSGGSNPSITYRNLYYNEQAIDDISGNKPAGVYALKFNSLVNA
ncbi:MAG: hypothetical protein PHX76_02855, partial [Patescibacteria group bacterium]|nr:hypothetical protein [Patescibacteria group bacterium]